MVWLLSFVCGNFSAVFRIAFAIDLIVTLVRAFIASLAAVSMAAPTSIFCPVNNSLALFIPGILAQTTSPTSTATSTRCSVLRAAGRCAYDIDCVSAACSLGTA